MLRNLGREDEENSSSMEYSTIQQVNLSNNQFQLQKFNTQGLVNDGSSLLFCISVDGSDHSDNAFDVVTREFLSAESKMVLIHVFNNKYNDSYNYRNRKETVISTYGSKLTLVPQQCNFLIENRSRQGTHALEQVYATASKVNANYLVTGYYGIKGPKGDNNELSKGTNYLLASSTMPIIMMKDTKRRDQLPSGGFNWLFVFDKKYSSPFRCFQAFAPLVDSQRDFVYGFTLKDVYSQESDDIQEDFINEVQMRGIKNFQYEQNVYEQVASKIVTSKVNYGDINFDFVVIYNNSSDYRNEKDQSDIGNIVKNCAASICIYQV